MFPSIAKPKKLNEPLAIGPLTVPNPVLLAPMSGVTDAPFRRQIANQGAGLVISEMTACAALANGKRNAALRVKDHGAGLHAEILLNIFCCRFRLCARSHTIAG